MSRLRPFCARAAAALLSTALLAATFVGAAPRALATHPGVAGPVAYVRGGDIYLLDRTTGASTMITSTVARERDPAISPDGTQVAFARRLNGRYETFVMGIDGTGAQRITDNAVDDRDPAWSPDGSKLVLARHNTKSWDIYVFDLAAHTARPLARKRRGYEAQPSWSSAGDLIAFVSDRNGSRDIYTIDATSKEVVRRTSTAQAESDPEFAPDGIAIAFTTDVGGAPELILGFTDKPSKVRLTTTPASELDPSFSPDGGSLLFVRRNEGAAPRVMEFDLGSGDVRSVAGIPKGASGPAWGTRPAFDLAQEVGLTTIGRTYSAAVADYDNDGDEDVFISRHEDDAQLLRNDGGTFVEPAPGSFPSIDRHGCAWGDVDGNGLLDLFCTIGLNQGKSIKNKELWIQNPDHTFVNKAEEYGVTDQLGRGRQPEFIDVNHDNRIDLFVGNDYPRADGQPSINRLFINDGGTSFRSAPEYGLDVEFGNNCTQAADYDGDGWDDLLICGKERLGLFRNVDGMSFADVSDDETIGRGWRSDAELADLDNDGDLDLASLNRRAFIVHLQEEGRFELAYSRALEAGVELTTADATGDGLLDVYVVQTVPAVAASDARDLLFVNLGGGSFGPAPAPPVADGSGASVRAIDHDGDARPEFLVLNGFEGTAGPLQLLVWR